MTPIGSWARRRSLAALIAWGALASSAYANGDPAPKQSAPAAALGVTVSVTTTAHGIKDKLAAPVLNHIVSVVASKIVSGLLTGSIDNRVDDLGFDIDAPNTLRAYVGPYLLLHIHITGEGPEDMPRTLTHAIQGDELQKCESPGYLDNLVAEFALRAKRRVERHLNGRTYKLRLQAVVVDRHFRVVYPTSLRGQKFYDEDELPVALRVVSKRSNVATKRAAQQASPSPRRAKR